MAKRGRMSDDEKLFLDQYLDSKTDEELAQTLDRTVAFVAKYRKTKPHTVFSEEQDDIIVKLHSLYFWKEILTQLSTNELKSFEARWVALHQQFQDVLPTDQMQIKDLITLEILINRVLTEKQKVMSTIDRLEQQLKREEERPIEFQDTNLMLNIETQLNAAMASQNARTTEHMKLQEKKDAKFKDLKATRDQRFKQLEDSRKSFFDLMKILDEKDSRDKEGRQIELMKLAATKKRGDLGEYTEYEDGTVDRPLLNSDTTIGENDE
tara:strand:+ start:2427 stop:3224 length:798 start_codon:yes stop_codon:yes gene_type:complete